MTDKQYLKLVDEYRDTYIKTFIAKLILFAKSQGNEAISVKFLEELDVDNFVNS